MGPAKVVIPLFFLIIGLSVSYAYQNNEEYSDLEEEAPEELPEPELQTANTGDEKIDDVLSPSTYDIDGQSPNVNDGKISPANANYGVSSPNNVYNGELPPNNQMSPTAFRPSNVQNTHNLNNYQKVGPQFTIDPTISLSNYKRHHSYHQNENIANYRYEKVSNGYKRPVKHQKKPTKYTRPNKKPKSSGKGKNKSHKNKRRFGTGRRPNGRRQNHSRRRSYGGRRYSH